MDAFRALAQRSSSDSASSARPRVPELSRLALPVPMPSRLRLKTPWPIEARRKAAKPT